MKRLEWNNWYRSDGCRKWMDKTQFAGTSFTDIFYRGMRLVFLDEKGKPGILYSGAVFAASQGVVAANGRRNGFNEATQDKYLRRGMFKYNEDIISPKLRFEGPDSPDLESPSQYAEAPLDGSEIRIHFYNIIKDARAGVGAFRNGPVPENATGVVILAYFTAAVVLHEIMHNHGFGHPDEPNWSAGSDYASTLPQVALQSVVNAVNAQFGGSFPAASNDRFAEAGPKWHAWENLGRNLQGDVGAVAIPGGNVTDLYGVGNYNKLWQKYWAGGWSDWMEVDGSLPLDPSSSPVAVSAHANHRAIYARGKDGQVYHKYWDGQWHAWENLGGQAIDLTGKGNGIWTVGDVGAVAIPGTNVTDLYVRGADGTLWEKYWAGKWSNWFQIDPSFKITSSPVAVSANANHRGIYARGQDGAVYHKYWDGQWHGWENLGGQIKGDVGAVILPGTNVTDLYVRGMDDTLWQKYYAGGWSDWFQVDPIFKMISSPVAVSANANHRGIYARGQDGCVYHKYYG